MSFFKKRPDWKKLNNEFKEAEKKFQITKQKWYKNLIRKKDYKILLNNNTGLSPCTNP